MLAWTLVVVFAAIAGLAVFIASRPAEFSVSRDILVNAPPEKVFAEIDDLKRWDAWSPWTKIDPNSKVTFDGPLAGKGSSMAWAGNKDVGEGRMTIVESRPHEHLGLELEFTRPFKAVNSVEFSLAREAGGTRVRWAMSGKNGFMGKAIGLVMDCEKMIGGQYETGLSSLKAVVERTA